MGVYIGDVPTFKHVSPDKQQALKVLEEASEVVDAFKSYYETLQADWTEPDNVTDCQMARQHLLDECADVIQATGNLLFAIGTVNMTETLERCRAKNEQRGHEYERDLEPSEQNLSDSREQLEADVQKWCGMYAYQVDMVYAWLNRQAAITRAECYKQNLDYCITCEADQRIEDMRKNRDYWLHSCLRVNGEAGELINTVYALEAECDELQEQVDKLQSDLETARAKNSALKAHISNMQNGRHGWHVKAKELQEQVDMLTKERDVWRDAVRNAHEMWEEVDTERNKWRDKCGKMLDIAHEITRLGDIE